VTEEMHKEYIKELECR